MDKPTYFTHTDEHGRAKMVDVTDKRPQKRMARASGRISLQPQTIALIRQNNIQKGDVLATAEIAGIQAAKRTAELIPLCHPLQIGKIDVKAVPEDSGVSVIGEVTCVGQTGVEMEALTAVTVALLTVYDMCKAVDKTMWISDIVLEEKTKSEIASS